ncbi:L-rhamnose mutarotase [Pectinatus haikarae]|uniref:L-rhamnose mutarotase n=1 Tax=Pectinatus haikarae TaxID=349096 RepID=A0ABT9Y630_9FIRM|nr:L-rhamnose mutarotase [Pectinatus haikarae]MDQ0203272.1 L-rhamnose mutarotase [Pectinatus haikarae]
MERFAWKAVIKDGMIGEYKKRHDNIWPEMKKVLKDAGIKNYTIWNTGNEVFGYFECEKSIAYAEKYQAESAVVDKWNEYMKDVMTMEMDKETGAQPKMKQVFFLE